MNPTELEAANQYINQMAGATQAGTIRWAKTNPTTFTWRKVDTNGRITAQVSLQKVVQRRQVVSGTPPRVSIETTENFIFQAIELPSNSLRLIINSEQDPTTRPILKSLFDTISPTIDRAGLDFLRSIVEG